MGGAGAGEGPRGEAGVWLGGGGGDSQWALDDGGRVTWGGGGGRGWREGRGRRVAGKEGRVEPLGGIAAADSDVAVQGLKTAVTVRKRGGGGNASWQGMVPL